MVYKRLLTIGGVGAMLLGGVAPTLLDMGQGVVVYAETTKSSSNLNQLTGGLKQWQNYPTDGDWTKFFQQGGAYDNQVINGGGTLAEYGCFITSVAIVAARSGGTSVKIDNETYVLNPASVGVSFGKNGVLDGGGNMIPANIDGSQINGFKYVGSRSDLGGLSKTNKIAAIQDLINKGYYPIIKLDGLASQYQTHFIAVHKIDGDTLYVADPVKNTTEPDTNIHKFENGQFYTWDNLVGLTWFEGSTPITQAKDAATASTLKVENSDGNIIDVGWDGKIPGLPERRDYKEADVIIQLKSLITPDEAMLLVKEDKGVTDWVDDYKARNNQDAVDWTRMIFTILASLMLFYSIIFGVAWLVDRAVPMPIDLFTIVTFGKLAVSYTDEGTFMDKGARVKEVNAKTVILLMFLMWIVSVLVLTGTIYRFLDTGVDIFNAIRDWIGSLGGK